MRNTRDCKRKYWNLQRSCLLYTSVDFTGNEDIDYWETICDEVRVCNGIKRMLDAGVNPDRMTIFINFPFCSTTHSPRRILGRSGGCVVQF